MATDLPQFVRDWQAARAPLLEEIKEGTERRRSEMMDLQKKNHAYQDIWMCFTVWIPLLENSSDPKAQRVAREMRVVDAKVRSILNA